MGILIVLLTSLYVLGSSEENSCNVLGIELRGDIHTYVPLDYDGDVLGGWEDTTISEEVIYFLNQAQNSKNIKAVLIEVDSYGGSPAAAEEISNTIASMEKPVISFIREAGLSAGYFSIVPSDYIFALRTSDVGGIGTTASYIDNVRKNQIEGLSYIQLSTGKFKDTGSPDKPLTQEERDLVMRDLQILHDIFVETVATHRNMTIEQVRLIADGSSVLGDRAKELGLIDEIGDYATAQQYISDLIGEDVSVCW